MIKADITAYIAFILMILFLVMAFIINDAITSQLLASFGIITGAFTSHKFSKSNKQ